MASNAPDKQTEAETAEPKEILERLQLALKDKRVLVAAVAVVILAPLLIALIALNTGNDATDTPLAPGVNDEDATITVEISSLDELEALVTELEELQTRSGSQLDPLDQFAE